MGVWDRDAVMNEGWDWGVGAGFGVQDGRVQQWVQDRILGAGLRVWGVGQDLGCSTRDLGCRSGFGVQVGTRVHLGSLTSSTRVLWLKIPR